MPSEDQTTAEAVRRQLETTYPDLEWVIVQHVDVVGDPWLTYRGRMTGSRLWMSGTRRVGPLSFDRAAVDHTAHAIATAVQQQIEALRRSNERSDDDRR